MDEKYVNIHEIVNKINEKNNFELIKYNKASDYFSELMEMIGADKNLYLKDISKKTLGYKIPVELEPLLIFFFTNWTSNDAIKILRREFNKSKKTKIEDNKNRYNNEIYNLKKEFMRFIIDNKELDEKQTIDSIITLSQSNLEIYEIYKDSILDEILDSMNKMSKELSYKNNDVNFININERMYLLGIYKEKFKDMLEELKIAKDNLDSSNIDIIKESCLYDVNDKESNSDDEKNDQIQRINDIVNSAEISLKEEKNTITNKLDKDELKRIGKEIESIKLARNIEKKKL